MSKTILDQIRLRRSIRNYTDKNIPASVINQILEAGRWAPSGLNNQPWRFLVIKNKDILKKNRIMCLKRLAIRRVPATCNLNARVSNLFLILDEIF